MAASDPGLSAGRQDAALTGRQDACLHERHGIRFMVPLSDPGIVEAPRERRLRTTSRMRYVGREDLVMPTCEAQYDNAMFDFSRGDYDSAIAKFLTILADDPQHFDAQLALGMAYCRKGNFKQAIIEGHKAEKLRPREQLVHTNLSLFYMKSGDKATAEHHGLQARIASWQGNMAPPGATPASDAELAIAKPQPAPVKLPEKFPDMPWKKKPTADY